MRIHGRYLFRQSSVLYARGWAHPSPAQRPSCPLRPLSKVPPIPRRGFASSPAAAQTHRRHEAQSAPPPPTSMERPHRAFIALGSNMGDRFAVIEDACKSMERQGDLRILRTSGLWETQAMYVPDQDAFLNGACEVETSLDPHKLLDRLQSIERDLGRVKLVDKGPRNIDLDILLYDQEVIDSDRLVVPHRLMLEREFVLRPLAQLIPEASLPAGSSAYQTVGLPKSASSTTIAEHLQQLQPSDEPISTLTPISPNLPPLRPLVSAKKTHVMSIINLTPDSFSDGGRQTSKDGRNLSTTLLSHLNAGASIIDIGGQSTRPHAPTVSPEDELSRLEPAMALFPKAQAFPDLIISSDLPLAFSIDTFYGSVARATVHAGAHIVNDVSAGTLDDSMLPTLADLGCTVVLMHMRGDPSTMTRQTSYTEGVVETVASELRERVDAAMKAGIRRWRIVLDPGIGFAKTSAQSLELLRRLPELRAAPGLEGLPWLIGTSRKGFVGKVTGVKQADQRGWGTAATVAAAIQGGADIVRVHDVKEMVEVTKMSDAIWRV